MNNISGGYITAVGELEPFSGDHGLRICAVID